jgi:hypothetical protein
MRMVVWLAERLTVFLQSAECRVAVASGSPNRAAAAFAARCLPRQVEGTPHPRGCPFSGPAVFQWFNAQRGWYVLVQGTPCCCRNHAAFCCIDHLVKPPHKFSRSDLCQRLAKALVQSHSAEQDCGSAFDRAMEPVTECENEWEDSDGEYSRADAARLATLLKDMERQVRSLQLLLVLHAASTLFGRRGPGLVSFDISHQ